MGWGWGGGSLGEADLRLTPRLYCCQVTNAPLEHKVLNPNVVLRGMIITWKENEVRAGRQARPF